MATMRTITAKYDGRCAKCNGVVKAGTRAYYGGGIINHYVCPKIEKRGAVVIFADGVTPEQIEAFLSGSTLVESYRSESYDPEWGSPVWYIP